MNQENSTGRVWKTPLIFGVLLPIVAVLFDPYVFQGESAFSRWAGAGYALIAIGVLSMCYWLLSRTDSSFLAGIFAVCSFLAWVIAVLILPASVIGIFLMGIGLLGFIPFGTAYVFYKAARVVWSGASSSKNQIPQFAAGILFVLLVIATCQNAVESALNKATAVMANADMPANRTDKLVLFVAEPLGLRRNIVDVWRKESDSKRALHLMTTYKERYGVPIDLDEMRFFD